MERDKAGGEKGEKAQGPTALKLRRAGVGCDDAPSPGENALRKLYCILACLCAIACAQAAHGSGGGVDPLPSWNDTRVKRHILAYVKKTADPSGPAYIPTEERIATFDNDGTLWCEKPDYPQLALSLQYLGLMHPPHVSNEPVRLRPDELKRGVWRVIDGVEAFFRTTVRVLNAIGLVLDLHRGMSYEKYEAEVEKALAESRHPRFQRPYTETVYQPMLELMNYLRDNGFRVYIVTAGGSDFVRAFSHKTYGVETSNVVGGTTDFKFKMAGNRPMLIREFRPLTTLKRGRDKPVNIHVSIGKRPVMAAGNSDGDLTMLLFTEHEKYPTLRLLVHHDDAKREYAYTRGARRVLEAARKYGWNVISMRDDWNVVFPFELP